MDHGVDLDSSCLMKNKGTFSGPTS